MEVEEIQNSPNVARRKRKDSVTVLETSDDAPEKKKVKANGGADGGDTSVVEIVSSENTTAASVSDIFKESSSADVSDKPTAIDTDKTDKAADETAAATTDEKKTDGDKSSVTNQGVTDKSDAPTDTTGAVADEHDAATEKTESIAGKSDVAKSKNDTVDNKSDTVVDKNDTALEKTDTVAAAATDTADGAGGDATSADGGVAVTAASDATGSGAGDVTGSADGDAALLDQGDNSLGIAISNVCSTSVDPEPAAGSKNVKGDEDETNVTSSKQTAVDDEESDSEVPMETDDAGAKAKAPIADDKLLDNVTMAAADVSSSKSTRPSSSRVDEPNDTEASTENNVVSTSSDGNKRDATATPTLSLTTDTASVADDDRGDSLLDSTKEKLTAAATSARNVDSGATSASEASFKTAKSSLRQEVDLNTSALDDDDDDEVEDDLLRSFKDEPLFKAFPGLDGKNDA